MTLKLSIKQLIVIPLLALSALAAHAGNVPPPKADLGPLYEQWGLGASQIAEVEASFEQLRAARQELREQDFASRSERREAMRALRETHRERLQTVLSEQQLRELKEYMRQFRRHRGYGKGGFKGSDSAPEA